MGKRFGWLCIWDEYHLEGVVSAKKVRLLGYGRVALPVADSAFPSRKAPYQGRRNVRCSRSITPLSRFGNHRFRHEHSQFARPSA